MLKCISKFFKNQKDNIYLFGFYFLTLFSILFIVYFVYLFSQNNVVEHDDAFLFLNRDIDLWGNFFVNVYHGKYIPNFLLVFFGTIIPAFFNIHPVVWIQTGGAVIKGLFFALFSFTHASMFYVRKKSILFLPILALCSYIFVQSMFLNKYQNELYASFYTFTFPFVFYFIFWKILYSFFIEEKKLSHFENVLFYFFAFSLGCSSEITAIASLSSISILLIYLFFSKKILEKKQIIFSYFSILLGFFSMIENPSFKYQVQEKGALDLSVVQTIFPQFMHDFWTIFKSDYFFLIVVIILLFIYIALVRKKESYRFLLLTFSMVFGVFSFLFSLIFAGKHVQMNYLYIVHFDLILQAQIAFISIVFMLLGYIHYKCKVNISYILVFVIISIIFGIFPVYKNVDFSNCKSIKQATKLFVANSDEYYKIRYLDERIFAYYSYLAMEPILSSNLGHYANEYYVRNVYNKNFKLDRSKVVFLDNKDEVYKQYLQNGGCSISDNEIEIANFNKLLDKNFVLYCK